MNALLSICEQISTQYKALQILVQPVVSVLLPVLFNKLTNTESQDTQFVAFKVYADIMS